MSLEEVRKRDEAFLFQNYGRADLCFSRGEREFLYDLDGKEYLDLVAGIAVNVLGHAHPSLVNAIIDQVTRLMHVSNLYLIKEQVDLGEAIDSITPDPLSRSMFVNSGTEANEAAIKMAVRHTGRGRFVTAERSFHGRTAVSLAATGQPKYHEGYEPILPCGSFDHVPYNDPEALKSAVTAETAAVILEPVQGESGIIPGTEEYFRTARDVCDDTGAMLIMDEVQTGIGRTGRMFGFEHLGIVPDAITMAKALGGGFPIGAVVTSEEISSCMTPGTHGTTFGGSPLACAVSRTVLETVKEDKLVDRSRDLGARLKDGISAMSSDEVIDVRGRGLMVGVELRDAKAFQAHALDNGVLVNVCGGSTVRMVPPLIVSEQSIDRALEVWATYLDV